MNRGETIKLRDLNAAFQNPKLISLAYYEGSLVVEHIVAAYGQPALNKLLRAYGAGARHRRRVEGGVEHRLRLDAGRLRPDARAEVRRRCARALAVPEGVEDVSRMPAAALKPLADANPRSFPMQMALGRALRKDGQLDEAMQAFERAAALVPTAAGKDSPHEQMAEIALQKKDTARAIAELTALVAVDFNNVEAARQLAALLRQTRRRGRGEAAAGRAAHRRHRSVRSRRARVLGRFALQRDDADAAAREFRTVIALGPVDRAAAYTDLAESYFKGGKRAEAKKQTLAALEIAPELRARAGPAAEDRRRRPAMTIDAARTALARDRCSRCSRSCRCCQPRADAQLPQRRRRSLRRPAVALRPHPLSLHHRGHARRAGLLRRAVVHRRAGRRAEPVAPRQDGDGDPGRGSDRHDARRSAAVPDTRGSISSSRAT